MNHFLKKMFFFGSCKESLHSGIRSKVVPNVSLCGVAACASRMVGDGSSVAPRWCLKKVPGQRLAARSVLMRDG